jgi:hypothetical protein
MFTVFELQRMSVRCLQCHVAQLNADMMKTKAEYETAKCLQEDLLQDSYDVTFKTRKELEGLMETFDKTSTKQIKEKERLEVIIKGHQEHQFNLMRCIDSMKVEPARKVFLAEEKLKQANEALKLKLELVAEEEETKEDYIKFTKTMKQPKYQGDHNEDKEILKRTVCDTAINRLKNRMDKIAKRPLNHDKYSFEFDFGANVRKFKINWITGELFDNPNPKIDVNVIKDPPVMFLKKVDMALSTPIDDDEDEEEKEKEKEKDAFDLIDKL